jgi:hypothetical protein
MKNYTFYKQDKYFPSDEARAAMREDGLRFPQGDVTKLAKMDYTYPFSKMEIGDSFRTAPGRLPQFDAYAEVIFDRSGCVFRKFVRKYEWVEIVRTR